MEDAPEKGKESSHSAHDNGTQPIKADPFSLAEQSLDKNVLKVSP
jgi:hypothetical protein